MIFSLQNLVKIREIRNSYFDIFSSTESSNIREAYDLYFERTHGVQAVYKKFELPAINYMIMQIT